MSEAISPRTAEAIAVEINVIKYHTGKVILSSIIEIGKRLSEARALLTYGEWSKWLEESVNYSQKTANNYISIAKAYGDYLSAPPDTTAPALDTPNLNYTQALILLGIPEEDRAQLMMDLDIDGMSTRELKKTVDEIKKIKQEKEEAEQKTAELEQALDGEREKTRILKKERDAHKAKAEELDKTNEGLEQNAQKMTKEISQLKETSLYKSYKKVSSQLSAAQVKLATNKVASKYEALDKVFKELTYELNLLSRIDKEVHGEYKKMLKKFLLKAIDEGIED